VRCFLIVTCALAAAVPALAAQPPEDPSSRADKPLTLSGCTPAPEVQPERYPLLPTPAPRTSSYKTAAGTALTYVGHRVAVTGRLIPSATIAGQASNIDQVFIARDFVMGEQNRDPLASTRVSRVRLTTSPQPFDVTCPSR